MRVLCAGLLFTLSVTIYAQPNLIQNPDFEEYYDCEYDLLFDPLEEMIPHWSFRLSTPRYFNADCFDDPLSDYYNSSNVIQAASGKGFVTASMTVSEEDSSTVSHRNYFQTQLISPIQPNKKYYFSMDVGLPFGNERALSHIGIWLTDTLWYGEQQIGANLPILLDPQIEFTEYIPLDTNEVVEERTWSIYEQCFTASEEHHVMVVGNFAHFIEIDFFTPRLNGLLWLAYDNFHLYEFPDTFRLDSFPDTICIGDCITLSTNHSNIPGDWLWDVPGATIVSDDEATITVCYYQTGAYDIGVATSHCEESYATYIEDAIVVLPPINSPLPKAATVCPGEGFLLDNPTNLQVQWADGNTTTPRMIATPGSYPYTLISDHCQLVDTFTLHWTNQPMEVFSDSIGCPDDTIYFGGLSIYQPGIYGDTIRDQNDCDSLYHFLTYTWPAESTIQYAGDFVFCENQGTSIDITSDYVTATWADGDYPMPRYINRAGTYVVSLTDSYGCTHIDTVMLISVPSPSAMLASAETIWFSTDYTLPAEYLGDIIAYQWHPAEYLSCADCPSPTLRAPWSGDYQVIVTNADGCSDTASLNLQLRTADIYIPNVVRPNSSIVANTRLYAQSNVDYTYALKVFDRWGGKLFDQSDLTINNFNEGWRPDPDVAEGIYVYLLTYEENGIKKSIKGDVMVVY